MLHLEIVNMRRTMSSRNAGRLLLLLQFFFQVYLGTNAQNYNGVIYLPAKSVSKAVSESAADMAYWLKQATGKQFEIRVNGNENGNGNGIYLEFADQSSLKLSTDITKKISADGQTFYLGIDGF